ncbi:hypothetical protein BC827DRAFT_177052 [Russula dissimulans]|nr:hypothetical protein BC827DRAFT_177052 [Russula dissimulans]
MQNQTATHHNHHHVSATVLDHHRTLQRFVHALGGIYVWEYILTFGFEWSFITGKRRFPWSMWVYVAIRLLALVNVVANLIQTGFETLVDCHDWVYVEYITVYSVFVLASFLMILKIAAIWTRNRWIKWILAASMGAWLTNIALIIRSTVTTSAKYESSFGTCVLHKAKTTRDSTLATLSSDMFLLIVMLFGLVSERGHHLGRLLFHQALIWLIVAIFSQVPLLVLISLKFDDLANLVFNSSSLISMTICVTRLYRTLNTSKSYQVTSPPRIIFTPFNPNNQSVQSQTTRNVSVSFAFQRSELGDEMVEDEPKSAVNTVHQSEGV